MSRVGWRTVGAFAIGALTCAQASPPPATTPVPAKQFRSRGVRVLQPDQADATETTAPAKPATASGAKTGPANVQNLPTPGARPAIVSPAPAPVAAAVSPAPVPPAPIAQAKPIAVQPPSVAVASRPPPPPLPLPAAVIKPCARPFANPDLRFVGGAGFDSALAARLRRGGPVVVDLARPYPLRGEPPAELKPWLGEVAASGGKTRLDRYCEGARGFGSFFASLFARDPRRIYRPARGYDAILHADALDQVVTQVEFRRRAPL